MASSVTGLPIPLEATEQQRRLGEELLRLQRFHEHAPQTGTDYAGGVLNAAKIFEVITGPQYNVLNLWVHAWGRE